MGISIRRIGTENLRAERDVSDGTRIYEVIDNGREFTITWRSHGHGDTLGLAGQPGFLYIDAETDTVFRQVIAVGNACGISIESDQAVEGLSPWAIRGVLMAERSRETRMITISAVTQGAGSDQPVILAGGEVADLEKYL